MLVSAEDLSCLEGDPNDSSEKIVKAYQPRFAILSGGVQSNKAMSPVMAHSGVLHMGMDATGDALSDQNRFPYYVRMTMADK
nr:hypothetical protein BaRGS_034773 [Batillaria attramentaria]